MTKEVVGVVVMWLVILVFIGVVVTFIPPGESSITNRDEDPGVSREIRLPNQPPAGHIFLLDGKPGELWRVAQIMYPVENGVLGEPRFLVTQDEGSPVLGTLHDYVTRDQLTVAPGVQDVVTVVPTSLSCFPNELRKEEVK